MNSGRYLFKIIKDIHLKDTKCTCLSWFGNNSMGQSQCEWHNMWRYTLLVSYKFAIILSSWIALKVYTNPCQILLCNYIHFCSCILLCVWNLCALQRRSVTESHKSSHLFVPCQALEVCSFLHVWFCLANTDTFVHVYFQAAIHSLFDFTEEVILELYIPHLSFCFTIYYFFLCFIQSLFGFMIIFLP